MDRGETHRGQRLVEGGVGPVGEETRCVDGEAPVFPLLALALFETQGEIAAIVEDAEALAEGEKADEKPAE